MTKPKPEVSEDQLELAEELQNKLREQEEVLLEMIGYENGDD